MSTLSRLARPTEHLLARLSLPGKIGLLGLTGLIMILLLLTLFLRSQWGNIQFSALELEGASLLEPLPGVIRGIQRHRGLQARRDAGDASVAGALDKARANTDAAFAAAAPIISNLGARLDVGDSWNALEQGWKQLTTTNYSSPDEAFRAHSELIARVISFVARVADVSNLTLDPDIDSYYLMDASVFKLPAMVEIAASTRGLAASIAVRQTITSTERIDLAARLARFGDHAKGLETGLAKVDVANPAAAWVLRESRTSMDAAVKQFSGLLEQHFVRDASLGVDGATLFKVGTQLVDSGLTLWSVSIAELRHVIQTRVDRMKTQLWSVCASVAALLLITFYLFFVLRRSVARAAVAIADGARRIAGGDLDSEVRCATADEFGTIAQGLNQMRATLRASLEQERESARINQRIRFALDNVTIPVSVSDDQNALVYLNRSAESLWHAMAPAIQRRHTGFDAAKLIGGRLSNYFEDEETRSAYREELSGSRTLDTHLGGHELRVTVSPVRNGEGEYLGRVTQWLDRTTEVALEAEIADILQAVAAGDLSRRIDLAGKEGFFHHLSEGLNQVMDQLGKSLDEVVRVLSAIAQGDLTQSIQTRYAGTFGQLSDDTNTTVERLQDVVGRILDASGAISSAAGEIAAGNADLSNRTELQAASLEETASSMEQLNANVKQNAEHAQKVNALTRQANSVAAQGGQIVRDVVSTMTDIQASSQRIADINSVIDSIAFQTNILALNAAVEAARAGEQGRGFAVVAAEVRNLAQRSAQAAKEIKDLITESVTKVDGGVSLANQAGETMQSILSDFEQVAGLMEEITRASSEQSAGIGQVTEAVAKMDEDTQRNSALVEEAAAAAESLNDQVRGLSEAVSVFRVGHGDLSPPRQRKPRQLPVPDARGTEDTWTEF